MDLQWSDEGSEARFASYVGALSSCLGHADRVTPMRSYWAPVAGRAQER